MISLIPLLLTSVVFASTQPYRYRAIVCDAGSTGTRMYLYTIDVKGHLSSITGDKSKPGIATISPSDAAEYLIPLFKHMKEKVSPEDLDGVPLFVTATAGMRLLPEKKQEEIFDAAARDLPDLLKKLDLNIEVNRDHFRTSTGSEEGYWGFIAANFLQHRLDAHLNTEQDLTGVLDLGGSSTQVSFKCSGDDGASVRLNNIFTHSFLGYGAQLARQKLIEKSLAAGNTASPCFFKNSIGKLTGSGNGPQCREIIRDNLLTNEKCNPEDHCFFNDVEKPAKVCDKFIAISLYFFATDCLRTVAKNHTSIAAYQDYVNSWPSPSINQIAAAADVFCSTEWANVAQWHHEETRSLDSWKSRCFELNYIVTLLKDGYNLPAEAHSVSFLRDIEGSELEWTIGSFLEESLEAPSERKSEDPPDELPSTWIYVSRTFIVLVCCGIPGIFAIAKITGKSVSQLLQMSMTSIQVSEKAKAPGENQSLTGDLELLELRSREDLKSPVLP